MTAALLIAGGALAHAAWNIVLKASPAGGIRFVALTVALSTALLAPFGAPALLPSIAERPALAGLLIASGALHCGYFLLLRRAYAAADVSVVYPLARGTGPLLSVIAAVVVLGERPSPIALLGAAVVIAGVVVIGLAGASPSATSAASDPATDARGRRRRGVGVALGATVGVLIAGYTLLDAVAVTSAGLSPVGYFWGSLVVQLLMLSPWLVARGASGGDGGDRAAEPARDPRGGHPLAPRVRPRARRLRLRSRRDRRAGEGGERRAHRARGLAAVP